MRRKLLLLGLFILFMPVAFANVMSTLDVAFQPFQGWDTSSFYLRYQAFIDLLLFIAIFIAISTKLLKERLGKQASVILGVVLGISLTVGSQLYNFSLLSLTLPAMGIFLLMLAGALFLMSTNLLGANSDKADKTVVWTLSFVVIYALMRAVVPQFFDQLESEAEIIIAILNLIMAFAIIILLFKGVTAFGKGFGGAASTAKDAADSVSSGLDTLRGPKPAKSSEPSKPAADEPAQPEEPPAEPPKDTHKADKVFHEGKGVRDLVEKVASFLSKNQNFIQFLNKRETKAKLDTVAKERGNGFAFQPDSGVDLSNLFDTFFPYHNTFLALQQKVIGDPLYKHVINYDGVVKPFDQLKAAIQEAGPMHTRNKEELDRIEALRHDITEKYLNEDIARLIHQFLVAYDGLSQAREVEENIISHIDIDYKGEEDTATKLHLVSGLKDVFHSLSLQKSEDSHMVDTVGKFVFVDPDERSLVFNHILEETLQPIPPGQQIIGAETTPQAVAQKKGTLVVRSKASCTTLFAGKLSVTNEEKQYLLDNEGTLVLVVHGEKVLALFNGKQIEVMWH